MYYYKDIETGHFVAVDSGIGAKRTDYYTLPDLFVDHPKAQRTNAPPDANVEWYISPATRQWRKEPARGCHPMREGIHFLVGLLNAFLILSPGPFEIAAVLVFLGFLAYEITEGLRIRDWAYRDIGGHLIGLAIGTAGYAALYLAGLLPAIWTW